MVAKPKRQARLTGALYLFHIGAVTLAMVLRAPIFVESDPSSTFVRLHAAELAYRASIFANLLVVLSYVVVTCLLYGLLLPVSRRLSFIAAAFSLAGCVMGAVLTLILLVPLILSSNAEMTAAFSLGQAQTLALASVSLSTQGNGIALAFFGCYCLVIGYLVYRSTFLPRIIGGLLVLSGLIWLITSASSLLFPNHAGLIRYLIPLGALGEFALALWLVTVGLNVVKWNDRVANVSAA